MYDSVLITSNALPLSYRRLTGAKKRRKEEEGSVACERRIQEVQSSDFTRPNTPGLAKPDKPVSVIHRAHLTNTRL